MINSLLPPSALKLRRQHRIYRSSSFCHASPKMLSYLCLNKFNVIDLSSVKLNQHLQLMSQSAQFLDSLFSHISHQSPLHVKISISWDINWINKGRRTFLGAKMEIVRLRTTVSSTMVYRSSRCLGFGILSGIYFSNSGVWETWGTSRTLGSPPVAAWVAALVSDFRFCRWGCLLFGWWIQCSSC